MSSWTEEASSPVSSLLPDSKALWLDDSCPVAAAGAGRVPASSQRRWTRLILLLLCLVQHSEGGQSSGRQQEVMRHLHTKVRNVVKQVSVSWSRARPTLAAAWRQRKISFVSHLYRLCDPPMMILCLHNVFRKKLKNF